jgi:hypothetical protein
MNSGIPRPMPVSLCTTLTMLSPPRFRPRVRAECTASSFHGEVRALVAPILLFLCPKKSRPVDGLRIWFGKPAPRQNLGK